MSFKTFTRTWWRNNPSYPNGLEPCAGRKYSHGTYGTEAEAREACRAWNATRDPGRLSRKMEYEEV